MNEKLEYAEGYEAFTIEDVYRLIALGAVVADVWDGDVQGCLVALAETVARGNWVGEGEDPELAGVDVGELDELVDTRLAALDQMSDA